MKKILSVLCVLAVLGTAVFAQETEATTKVGGMDVSVYGGADARFGMQSMTIDMTDAYAQGLMGFLNGGNTVTATTLFSGLKNENAVKLGTKIASADGKFTADVSAKFATATNTATPVTVKSAWVAYDLGPVAVKFNSHDGNQRWDSDILYVGDATLQSGLDFTIKPVEGIGYAFFTVMSDNAYNGVQYENNVTRTIPIMSVGYVYTAKLGDMGEIEATLGGALDMPVAYTGYMGFGGAKWSKGAMASEVGSLIIGVNGLYGQNTGRMAGMSSTDMEQATLGYNNNLAVAMGGGAVSGVAATVSRVDAKDATVAGGRLYAGFTAWTGGVISVDARYSTASVVDTAKLLTFTAFRVTGGLTQFLSPNFNVTLGGGYETYGRHNFMADYKDANGYEVTLNFGFMF